mmetsp:Transcript_30119/g.65198  ORF Transcript_30119/g.65198 Transcript_30119/m.65198 type:complete len:470 (+) Transcript_30119:100-1509(+)
MIPRSDLLHSHSVCGGGGGGSSSSSSPSRGHRIAVAIAGDGTDATNTSCRDGSSTGTTSGSSTNIRRAAVVDRIAAMRRQEDTCYRCRHDYTRARRRGSTDFGTVLPSPPSPSPCTTNQSRVDPAKSSSATSPSSSSLPPALDPTCRAKITTWLYQISDYVSISHENVSFAMSYLDRYLATGFSTVGTTDSGSSCCLRGDDDVERCTSERLQYQLCAMTCLYLSIKLHEAKDMDTQLLSRLSHGKYSCDDIVAMEERIVFALQWRFSDPTTTCFCRHYVELVLLTADKDDGLCIDDTELDDQQEPQQHRRKDEILEKVARLATVQAELSAGDLYFVPMNNSTVALACICNALHQVIKQESLEGDIVRHISDTACIDAPSTDVEKAMERLLLLSEGSEAMTPIGSMSDISILASDHKDDDEESSSETMDEVDPRGGGTARQHGAAATAAVAAGIVGMKLSPVCISVTATR